MFIHYLYHAETNQFFKKNLQLIKRRSKGQQKNPPRQRVLNWEPSSENHKPIKVWLCLFYKPIENSRRLCLLAKLSQT